MSYKDLLTEALSLESSEIPSLSKEYIEIDDERDGESIISGEIKDQLDRNRINYIINPKKLSHPKALRNAVLDGVYHEEVDLNKKRDSSRRIKIIYDETVNVSDGVTAYVVSNEDIAESMESSGLKVLRTVDDVLEYCGTDV